MKFLVFALLHGVSFLSIQLAGNLWHSNVKHPFIMECNKLQVGTVWESGFQLGCNCSKFIPVHIYSIVICMHYLYFSIIFLFLKPAWEMYAYALLINFLRFHFTILDITLLSAKFWDILLHLLIFTKKYL